jgi:serine/threonine-protein kinase
VSVAARSRFGAYDVIALIGQGGMGEVWKATDTRLKRQVALKVLPTTFLTDPERIARFQREAEVLAALNHPNIAQIYGIEEANGVTALVLELVEGATLADRIAQGPIPIDEALPIAKQIAEALEAAHERGIIHRDLKPANIKIRPDGTVKVLDFGLAKLAEPARAADAVSPLTNSPTITSPAMMTGVGVLLGTAAYMSPEQAKGRAADKRSDIWAFGCVLFEMLTAKRAFEGEDVSDTLAAVLRGEPEWDVLPPAVAVQIRLLLRRCVEKDRLRRIADISTVRFVLTEPIMSGPTPAPAPLTLSARPLWKRAVWAAAFAIVGGAVVGAALWIVRPSRPQQSVTRFTYNLGEGERFTNTSRHFLALSQDGTQIAYVANRRLYLKKTRDLDAVPVSGAQASQGLMNPVFSPDGQSILFWSTDDNTLKKIATSGGAPVPISRAAAPYGMSWDGDSIFVGQGSDGIVRVSAYGGSPETVVRTQDNEFAHGPQLLPDKHTLLYTVVTGSDPDRWERAQIVVQPLGSSHRKTIIGGADGRYLSSGHLVYAVGSTLFAVPFDARHLEVVGGPVAVVEGVARAGAGAAGVAQFAVSRTGTLAYIPGPNINSSEKLDLALLDHTGTVTRLKLPPHQYQVPRVSPDGGQLAVGVDDGQDVNLWVYDLSGRSSIRQLTFGGKNRFPVWSADSARIAFQSDREEDPAIFWQRADGSGTAERLTTPARGHAHIPEAWSPKGDVVLFDDATGSNLTLWMLTVADKKAEPFGRVRSSYPSNFLLSPAFSPDGTSIAYVSDETENRFPSIFVRAFPATDNFAKVGSGVTPFWAPNGKELYFSTGDPGQPFQVVSVNAQPTFRFGNPTSVPRPGALVLAGIPRNYDVAPDGQHFVIVVDASDNYALGSPRIQVVLNWTEELKERVPAK